MRKNKFDSYYILVFCILYFSMSYFAKNLLTESINVAIITAVLFIVIIQKQENIIIKTKRLRRVLLLLIVSLLSFIVNIDTPKNMIYEFLVYILAIIIVSVIRFEDYCTIFVNCVYFISLISIPAWFVGTFFPKFLSLFPLLRNDSLARVYNLFFCVVRVDNGFSRLHGFCWEPGAFQTLLNITIGLLIFFPNIKNWKKKLVVIYIALILTFSTTGIIAGVINVALLYTRNRKTNYRIVERCILFGMGLLIVIIIIYPYVPNSIRGVSFGFFKINEFLSGTSEARGYYDSASVRYDAIYYALRAFLDNPVFGKGFREMIADGRMYTCTPINYFAYKGLLYGTIVMCGWFRTCKMICQLKMHQIIFFGMIMVTILSENYLNYLFSSVFIIYGLMNNV